ncbi:amino acid adenylation domain-containing protein [Actinacidiphila glaucinigra]|uniref:amino acid adenylation domain-containing protein n=1 Tax=Actinacidiphila glaucinigra TaxID=235986 RepID=UPI003D93B77A
MTHEQQWQVDGIKYNQLLDSLRGSEPWALQQSNPDPMGLGISVPVHDASSEWASVGAVIAQQCASTPLAVAIHADGEDLTYGELDAQADALASALIRAGVGNDDVVALVVERSAAFVVAVLAVWRAGAAYLPLAPSHPDAWLTAAARRAKVSLVLGKPIPGFRTLDEVPEHSDPVADRNNATHLAYVIATSGSTGTPKLVMIEHGGLSNLAQAQRVFLDSVPACSRVLLFAHPAFDAALFDIVLALTNGACLEIPDTAIHSGEPLAHVLTDRRITHAVLPASVLRTLEPGGFPNLDVLISIGDVCLPETARRWSTQHRFVNGYGPTETTICTTLHTTIGTETTRVPIGRPIAGSHVVVLDDNRRPVPSGTAGEIYIGGLGVGRGYLGDPLLTAERFVEDPAAGRLYRSGDLGRVLDDGTIEFLGRVDDQVKVRGARIELGQVEAALIAQPGVRDALAMVDRRGESRLLGYVIGDVDPDLLRKSLTREVPGYLVPDQIMVVERWPLTVSGKVDREALPRPGRTDERVQEPRNESEAAVVEAAAELLGIDAGRIDVNDDLLSLGGNSLFATQLVARLRSGLGAQIRLRTVLNNATPAAIAAGMDKGTRDLGPRPGSAPPAPSFGQRRVWLMDALNPGSRAYSSQSVFRLTGALSLTAFEASLTEIVRTQDTLRSRFLVDDGELTCVIDEPWPVRLDVHDLSKHPDQGAAVGTAVRELLEMPFDLAVEPPFRWALLRLGYEEHIFVHIEHHVIHDGWSLRRFVRDLLDGYTEHRAHGVVTRAAPPVSYYDYARWQREWLASPQAEKQRDFWRAELAGAETVLRLPRRTEAHTTRFLGKAPRLEIDADLARRLADLADRSRTTLFTTLLSAFFVLLHSYTGSRDLLVGSAVANRNWQQTEDVLGMFVNTVVFRGRLDRDPTFLEVLEQMRERSLGVYENQELPYDQIFEASPAAHGDSARPLIQAMFSFHDSPLGPLGPTPLGVDFIEGLSNGSAKFDISVVGVPRYAEPGRISQLAGDLVTIPASDDPVLPSARGAMEGLTLAWEFDTDLFDDVFCTHMPKAFERLLRSIVDAPHAPISQFDLVDDTTRAELLAWGRGPTAEPEAQWLPDYTARWARDTPEALAIDGPHPLTYADLEAWSDRIALHLRATGLGQGDVIAIRVPLSPELIVAQLAVMKSGAAFLPSDPTDPTARLTTLMADCGAQVLLTTETFAEDMPEGLRTVVLEAVPEAEGVVPQGKGSDVCYVMYTSGSTGTPKGVIIEHRSVAHRLTGDEVTHLRSGDTYLAVGTPAFDTSVLELWGTLMHGATLRILPRPWCLSELADALSKPEVSHANLATAVFNALAAEFPEAVRGLRHLGAGGDVMSSEAAARLRASGARHLTNFYGPTEITIMVTGMRLEEWHPARQPRVPIGRPLPNSSIYVVDDNLRLVPPGVVGEICIGGPGVARGYTQPLPGFLPNPYDEGRLYRTGDRGRWLDDGVVDFLGRNDGQVKIRGYRIEPAEVRTALLALPAVHDAVVLADRAQDALIAHVLSPRTGSDIQRALAEILPKHLVPNLVHTHEDFPLNAQGKVDLRALDAASTPANVPTAPLTPAEELIASLVAGVCGVQPDAQDNLFDLGMHSLQAMRLALRITAATGREVGLALVLTHPTVRTLTAAVASAPEATDTIPRLRQS